MEQSQTTPDINERPLGPGSNQKACTSLHNTWPDHLAAGVCLDPFAALINHSCDPNARFISEGTQLRVRTLKDISAGEELTVLYGPSSNFSEPRDYIGRQTYLKIRYGFDCTCRICLVGQVGPTGELRVRLLEVIRQEPARGASLIENLEEREAFKTAYAAKLDKCIADFEASSFPSEGYPGVVVARRKIESSVTRVQISFKGIAEVLKNALQIYFYMEPRQIEPINFDDRLSLLGMIVVILHLFTYGKFQLDGLKSDPNSFEPLFGHLCAKLWADTESCYGKESLIGMFEAAYFRAVYVDERTTKMAAGGIQWKYVALKDSADERAALETKMTELAMWAGLDRWTLMYYLPEWQPSWSV